MMQPVNTVYNWWNFISHDYSIANLRHPYMSNNSFSADRFRRPQNVARVILYF